MKEKNSLLKKVIILFIIVMLPFLGASFYYLYLHNEQQKEQTLTAVRSANATYLSLLDNDLKQLHSDNLYTMEQNLLKELAVTYPYLSPYEKSMRVNLLREQLYSICASSPFLESAQAYLFDYKIVYNSPNYKYGSYQQLSDLQNTFFQAMCEDGRQLRCYKDPVTDKNLLSIFIKPVSGYTACAINLILSEESIKKYLDSITSYPQDYYFFQLRNGFTLSTVPSWQKDDAMQLLSRHNTDSASAWQSVQLGGQDFFAFYEQTAYSNGTFIRLISASAMTQSFHYSYYLLFLLFLLVTSSCLIFFIGIYRMVHKPFARLTDAFFEVEKGNFQVQIDPAGNGDFTYLYHAFNDMTIYLNQLIEQDYQQKMLLQKAELKQLQAQINPHFLYNSFFMLQRMIKFDPDNAQNVASALASCFRYITRNSMDHVMLKEEYEHARNYAYIQGLRFEGRIRIELEELPEMYCNLTVPKLILQPILENAFHYGLNNKVSDGLLRVRFLPSQGCVTICIEDNGDELSDETLKRLHNQLSDAAVTSTGTEMSGILNIQRRLHIFSGYMDSLHISRSWLGGLRVEILLQIHKN